MGMQIGPGGRLCFIFKAETTAAQGEFVLGPSSTYTLPPPSPMLTWTTLSHDDPQSHCGCCTRGQKGRVRLWNEREDGQDVGHEGGQKAPSVGTQGWGTPECGTVGRDLQVQNVCRVLEKKCANDGTFSMPPPTTIDPVSQVVGPLTFYQHTTTHKICLHTSSNPHMSLHPTSPYVGPVSPHISFSIGPTPPLLELRLHHPCLHQPHVTSTCISTSTGHLRSITQTLDTHQVPASHTFKPNVSTIGPHTSGPMGPQWPPSPCGPQSSTLALMCLGLALSSSTHPASTKPIAPTCISTFQGPTYHR